MILQYTERKSAAGAMATTVGSVFVSHREQPTLSVWCDAHNCGDTYLLGGELRVHAAGFHWLALQVQSAAGQESAP